MSLVNWCEITSLGPEEILKVLPHRYPFLMVDRVLEVKTAKPIKPGMQNEEILDARKGSFARTLKNITFNEAQFLGHFPDQPLFPGVLTLEAMAQSGAFVVVPFAAALNNGVLPKLAVALAGFDSVRFRRPIKPGDQMEIKVVATHVKGNIWAFDGVVSVESKTAAQGNFLAQLITNTGS